MYFFASALLCTGVRAQETPASGKPTEHLLGTVTAVDQPAHTITVKDDKSSGEQVVLLADTKTLLKVAPGAKDLKTASRITADDLAVGDRVDIRGFKAPDDATKIAARSVVLMSARELQQAHQAQAAEWQHSTPGVVSSIDPSSGKLTITTRTAEGPKPMTVETTPKTEFTRYSPDTPASPVASQLAQIQAGDQVRVVGDPAADGASITARKIYSGAFRTINGTIASINPDGKHLVVNDLSSKQSLDIVLGNNSSIRKLPLEMAAGLARRMAGGARAASGGSNPPAPAANGPTSASAETPAAGASVRQRGGDVSQMIDRLPQITASDLKPGDAVVISGVVTGTDNNQLIATHVIAGVEPILQSAPARQRGAQLSGGDFGLSEMAAPQQ